MNDIAADLFPYRSHDLKLAGATLRYVDEGPTAARGSGREERSREEALPETATALAGGDRSAEDGSSSDVDTLLCVHGNPTWSFYWRRVIERFADRKRVVAVDHLGCGRSDKPPRGEFPYTLAAHRDNLVRLIDEADLRRITLVAHDWGGAIGLAAVLERPERLRRIVLLNTGAFPPPYLPWRIAACRWPLIGTAAVRGLNLFARAAIPMAMSRQKMDRSTARGLLAPYDSWNHRVAIDAFVRDIPMRPSHPTYATLRSLEQRLPSLATLPSLIVWGMRDWCFRPECLDRFVGVWPDAEVVKIEDAGHYVIEDAPDETLAAMERFLFGEHREAEAIADASARNSANVGHG